MNSLSGVAEERLTGRNALLNPYEAEPTQADPVSVDGGSSAGSSASKGCFAATGRLTTLPFGATAVLTQVIRGRVAGSQTRLHS